MNECKLYYYLEHRVLKERNLRIWQHNSVIYPRHLLLITSIIPSHVGSIGTEVFKWLAYLISGKMESVFAVSFLAMGLKYGYVHVMEWKL